MDFKTFNEGQTFRLQFTHRNGRNSYPESVYCIFKSCKYLGESDILEELVVDQIIEIDNYLNDEEYQTVERKFKHLRNIHIYYQMHD
jgi:hypothetical protein